MGSSFTIWIALGPDEITVPQKGDTPPLNNDPLVIIIYLFVQIVKAEGCFPHAKSPPSFDRGLVLTVIQDYSWPASFL